MTRSRLPKIKNLLPRQQSKKQKFLQGYYDIHNPKKYFGPRPIIYRSSWELKFMMWCENNSNVIEWSSESTAIPYYDNLGNRHMYYLDFTVKLKNSKTLIVEVKPKSDIPKCDADLKNPRKAQNFFKWRAAKEFAKQNVNMEFVLVTEDFFK